MFLIAWTVILNLALFPSYSLINWTLFLSALSCESIIISFLFYLASLIPISLGKFFIILSCSLVEIANNFAYVILVTVIQSSTSSHLFDFDGFFAAYSIFTSSWSAISAISSSFFFSSTYVVLISMVLGFITAPSLFTTWISLIEDLKISSTRLVFTFLECSILILQ